MKKQKTVNKRLVNGFLTWRILLGETSYNTETSSGSERLQQMDFPIPRADRKQRMESFLRAQGSPSS